MPPPTRTVEDNLNQFIQTQQATNSRLERSIDDIKNLVTQSLTKEKGTFPAQPLPNPNRQAHAIKNNPNPTNHEQVQAVTTLRSGKTIDKTIFAKQP